MFHESPVHWHKVHVLCAWVIVTASNVCALSRITRHQVYVMLQANTVGIVQCKIDFYVNFIRKVSQKCLKCYCVKYCKLIHNVL